MNYETVVEIMGEPMKIFEFEKNHMIKKRLVFLSPRLASTATQCTLNPETGLVEQILCGEE